jgi:Protein of unknown function (DUF3999)
VRHNFLVRLWAHRPWLAAVMAATATSTFVASAGSADGPLPASWKFWRYSRAIEVPVTAATRLVSVVLRQDVFPRAQENLADLRVIDDQGTETSWSLLLREGSKKSVNRNIRLRENSYLPGQYTQALLDLGESPAFHNAVEIETTEPNYIEWVQVAASDDAHQWRIVQHRAPIFHFQKDNQQGTRVVHYSENNARYLRLQIYETERQFPVTGAQVLDEVVEPPERVAIAATMTEDSPGPAGTTTWTFDLGTPNLAPEEVRFTAGPTEFSRAVDIENSQDKKGWEPSGYGEIYRFRQGESTREELAIVMYQNRKTRYWRVIVRNGNDTPVTGATPTLYMTPRHVVFEQQSGRNYRLLYGQSQASEAQYDLARRVSRKQMEAAVTAVLGPEAVNTDWADPRPWTEKYDVVLWLALGIAVVLLGFSALRSLRRSARGTEDKAA